MNGDFTRFTFDRRKHYSSVRMQQGRVQLDADWNESADITANHLQTQARDFIGASGAPHRVAGFKIDKGGNELKDLRISPGRLYVDGILCENEAEFSLGEQPDLWGHLGELPDKAGLYIVYLDVWSRHITALDDASIREVSLEGADTSTRLKTVWQVRLLRVGPAEDDPSTVWPSPKWDEATAPGTGKLNAQIGNSGAQLQNQLYRIQIHRIEPAVTGSPEKVWFKWSRDNASVMARWVQRSGNELLIDNLMGPPSFSFSPGDWVELTDSAHELRHQPGTLVQIVRAGRTSLTIDPDTATGTLEFDDFEADRKVVGWSSGEIEAVTDVSTWFPLEDGLELQFSPGTFKPGDYWLIPARSFTRSIEWPRDNRGPIAQLPHGVEHHYCRLALVDFDPKHDLLEVCEDSRFIFLPLAELKELTVLRGADNAPTGAIYVDGQGRVGLGTTEPRTRLEVAGDFRLAKGVAIDEISDKISTDPVLVPNTDSAVPTQKAVAEYVKEYVDEMLVGSVAAFAMDTPPEGWLECNGQAVSRTGTYARLFERISTTFGAGNGETTFNVPDLRGEFIRGWDKRPIESGGVDPGRALGNPQTDRFQDHGHEDNGHAHYYPVLAGVGLSGGTVVPGGWGAYCTSWWSETGYANICKPTQRGERAPNVGSETRPRNIALLYCIKY